MPTVGISLRDLGLHGQTFDPDIVVDLLEDQLDHFVAEPGCQLEKGLTRARDFFVQQPYSPAQAVVLRQMIRDQITQGPCRAFHFTLAGHAIQGVMRRLYLSFHFEAEVSHIALEKIRQIVSHLPPLNGQYSLHHVWK